MRRLLVPLLFCASAVTGYAEEPVADDLLTAPAVGFENYLVRWWGAPGSEWTRPIYRIARFDTGQFRLHYGIVPGRELSNYSLPYWPIRSFLSIESFPAEITQTPSLSYLGEAGRITTGFVPRSGVELAAYGNTLAVRIRNRSLATPEDTTLPADEPDEKAGALSLSQVFLLEKDATQIPVTAVLENTGSGVLADAAAVLVYEQSFSWGEFAVKRDGSWEPVEAPAAGEAEAFYAYSTGMDRAYTFFADRGSTLSYELASEFNQWRVQIASQAVDLAPGETQTFAHTVAVAAPGPGKPPARALPPLEFTRFQPSSFKTAPVDRPSRVAILDQLVALNSPKARGLNPSSVYPQVLDDLETLRHWGGNMAITHLQVPEHTEAIVQKGHSLGMEVFVSGSGSYKDGPPSFESYYAVSHPEDAIPDGHGQDEDHYYWSHIEPARDFASDFGKPMARAAHHERITYWARCFADKWQGVRRLIQPHAPDSDIWFYAPFPSVPYVDPIDSYAPFLRELVEQLGPGFTVFPFYYGIEYNQAEYMARAWKEAGAERAIFLPMRDFMTRPSQFIRAISAARRGGADGACGFHIAIGKAAPEDQWQWRAILLGAWANFPTADLDAISAIENPADLVEKLATPGLGIRLESEDEADGERLKALAADLPTAHIVSDTQTPGDLTIRVTGHSLLTMAALQLEDRAVLELDGDLLILSGPDAAVRDRAWALLQRFAEVARDEYTARRHD